MKTAIRRLAEAGSTRFYSAGSSALSSSRRFQKFMEQFNAYLSEKICQLEQAKKRRNTDMLIDITLKIITPKMALDAQGNEKEGAGWPSGEPILM